MTFTDLMTEVASWSRIDEALSIHARRTPDAVAASFEGRHWSWAEFNALVEKAAQALMAAGVAPGDRVALLSTPRPEYLLVLMAVSRVGAVYVGLNPRYTANEVAEIVERVRPRLLITLRAFEGQDFLALIDAMAGNTALPEVVSFDSMEGCADGLQVIGCLPPPAPDTLDPQTRSALSDTAAIVFTSGTTGRPKAAMLTHRGLLHAAVVQHLRLNPAVPRILCNLPINHVGCLMNLTLAGLVGGGSVVFLQRFSAAHTLKLIHDEHVNCWLQVPAMYHECVRDATFDPKALGHLHSICIGGGAASAQTIAKLREIGVPLFVEYGQTETSSSAAYSDADADDDVLSQCIGRFDPHFEFRIADKDGQPCAMGEMGEIQGRGKLIFAGYYGDPQATRDAFTSDGWLHTGDLALQRPDGNVMIQGRLKEMIKSGGYNVYPREVELVLESHPGIGQVVVVGLPDERYGEAVHAVITWRGEAVGREELIALCRNRLANYKVPKSLRVVDAFPLLPNGKINRVETREMAAGLPELGPAPRTCRTQTH